MFEHSLIDLEAKPSTRRRWLSLPIAVGLHVAGLTAFAFASYWTVGSVPEPQLSEVFFVNLPPPPPGGGGGPRPPVKTPEIKKQAPQPASKALTQPTAKDVPEKPPAPAVNDSIQNLTPGPVTPGLGPGGPGTGEGPGGPGIGGPGDGPGDGPGVGPGIGAETAPIHLSFGMTKPEVIHQVQPRYSEQARRAGVQGMVIVEAVIDEQGQVTNVRLVRGLP
ncbi:MAG TPA: TonB family protein, partial [Thermoanaerobaculia bacterium]|nr:TonB family protein [Thermoanaerobaculia bacterium]